MPRISRALKPWRDDRVITRLFDAYSNGSADDAAIQSAVDAMLDRLGTDLARGRLQQDILTRSEEDLSLELTKQSAEQIELAQLEREVEATRLLYESFLTRLKETNVQQGLQTPDSRILSEAVPRPASSPRIPMVLAVSLLLGLIAGTIAVLLNEMRQTAFRTADQLKARTGKTVFGSIPVIPSRHRRDALKYLRDKPTSVVAEAVRNLRTSILMSQADRPPQIIMVTSSVPGEGKTTVSLSMAQNMASLGQRVLLIEGDIRRRTFNQYFSAKSGHDLMSAMKDPTTITPGTLREGDLGVDVLVGTKTGMNAADVFSSRQFADLLAHMRTVYDHIIIDTPPVLVVPDARVIAPYADARVYVVYWNKTTATQVTQGIEMLGSVGYPVSGLVLTQVNSRKMRAYGYGGEYGYDGYQSKYYDS